MRHRKNAKNTPVPSRMLDEKQSKLLFFYLISGTPAAPSTTDSPPSDTREKLLNNASNIANETN